MLVPPLLQRLLARRQRAFAMGAGGLAPLPVRIPYSWIKGPVLWRQVKPWTAARVSSSTDAANLADASSVDEYGESTFSATLATDSVQDLTNLAHFTLAYYATQPGSVPRSRFAPLTLVSMGSRTTEEQQRILGVGIGTRIYIDGAPARWPEGLTDQVVVGILRSIAPDATYLAWYTEPVVGTSPGTAGPWFRVGHSALGGPDVIPF